MSKEITVAVIQMTSVDDSKVNLHSIHQLMQQVPESVDLVCFPENCIWMRLIEGGEVQSFSLTAPEFGQLAVLAKAKKAWFHMGSVAIKTDAGVKNSSVLISPEGEIRATYEKIHLFDIELDGQAPVRESDVFRSGEKPEIVDISGWRMGQTICYDLRFSELFSYYAQHLVDVVLVPAAFLVPTGKAHWEVLLRARAIESQVYVIAAAQAGRHQSAKGERQTYGHSLIIDPWGKIIAEGGAEAPQVLIARLSKEHIEKVRTQIPMRHHRKLVAIKG